MCGQGLLVFLALLGVSGCKKRQEAVKLEEVYTNRANDKGYIASLMTNRQQQVQEGRLLVAVSLKMTQCVTRVRATLPEGAPDEALRKALAADSEWTTLDEQAKQLKVAAEATLQQAKDMMVRRMREEARAQQAVADGKARAIDSVPASKAAEKK